MRPHMNIPRAEFVSQESVNRGRPGGLGEGCFFPRDGARTLCVNAMFSCHEILLPAKIYGDMCAARRE